MKIPEKLLIAGVSWTVRLVPDLESERESLGECHKNLLEIRIDKDIPLEQQRLVFFHELLHAVCETVGMRDGEKFNEEQFVSRITSVLFGTLKDNKLFL